MPRVRGPGQLNEWMNGLALETGGGGREGWDNEDRVGRRFFPSVALFVRLW